jgi:hypothetical protein
MPRINEPCHPPRRHANTEIDEQGILSSRSLLIMTISAATALLAGASAGISAAVALPASIGVAGRVALGILDDRRHPERTRQPELALRVSTAATPI